MKRMGMVLLLIFIVFMITGCTNGCPLFGVNDRSACLFGKAIEEESPETCKDLGVFYSKAEREIVQWDCLYLLAFNLNDSIYCEQILDNDMQNRCYALTLNDPKYCQKMKMFSNFGSCLDEIAYKTKNESVCDLIGQRTECNVNSDEEDEVRVCQLLKENGVNFFVQECKNTMFIE